jgi:arylmalonate decarboxylase
MEDKMYGEAGRIGLAVLDIDLTIEPDLRRLLPEGVEIHASRVIYPHEVTPEALEQAAKGIDQAIKSLIPLQPRSLVWACTSGSFFRGRSGHEALLGNLNRAANGLPVTTASGAVVAALTALHVRRPAVGTPYSPAVNSLLFHFLEEYGLNPYPVESYFGKSVDDITLQSLSENQIADFIERIDRPEADAILVSCTGLATATLVPQIEAFLKKPVITSNLAILWHAMNIGGIKVAPNSTARLFQDQ